jgi:hypothetical protein
MDIEKSSGAVWIEIQQDIGVAHFLLHKNAAANMRLPANSESLPAKLDVDLSKIIVSVLDEKYGLGTAPQEVKEAWQLANLEINKLISDPL